MVCKKGSGHFEMVISFVFFVGFVFFLFVVLSPSEESQISGAVVYGLYNSFEEEVYTNLSEVFLKTNYTGAGDCFYVELPGRIFTYALGAGDSYVTGLDGDNVISGIEESGSDGMLHIEETEAFYRVAISPEFSDDGSSGCEVLNDYELGSIDGRRVISYSALASMATAYYTDYDGMKSSLGVPEIYDFAIVPETLISVRMEPPGIVSGSIEVLANDYVVEVLYANGTVINEKISFRIW